MKAFTLTARDELFYQILRRLAEQRAPTPTQIELGAMLGDVAPRNSRSLWDATQRLSRHGLAHAVNGLHPSLMTYRVLVGGVWKSTMPRAEAKELAAVEAMSPEVGDRQGWPVPTKASARSYDRAVMRRDFAKHEVRRQTTETRVHGRIRGEVERLSYVGCAAEMCCS